MKNLPEFVDYLLTKAQYEPHGEALGGLVSRERLSEEDLMAYFPNYPREMSDIVCHRLLIRPEPWSKPLVLSVYYSPDRVLRFNRPPFVVDKNVVTGNQGPTCAFISVVAADQEEATRFIEAFLNRLGLADGLETSLDTALAVMLRPKYH